MKTRQGFSIIELMIVMAVIALVIPALFMMFLSTLQARAKLYALQETKRAGDYVFNAIQQTIRNRAVSIHNSNNIWDDLTEVCSTKSRFNTAPNYTASATDMYFKDKNNIMFYYSIATSENTTKIASYSGSMLGNTMFLTNKHTAIMNIPTMRCFRTSIFSPPIVEMDFEIASSLQSGLRHEELDTFKYTIKVKLRN